MKVEDVKEYIKVSDEFIQALKKFLDENASTETNMMEDLVFNFKGVTCSFIEIESSPWDDQGKYQYQEVTYIVESEFGKHTNVLVKVDVIRSGSYFSAYYYEYEKPVLYTIGIKTVPEQYIPEHEVIIHEKA